ncbi:MAG: hypothetical protein PHV53_03835 [Fermentimonas sp.]|nr:hypothetical protein [Fermentimonas sp.]
MKNILIVLAIALTFVGCEKDETKQTDELKSLKGTEWVGTMPDYFENNVVIVKVLTDNQATFTISSVTIAFNYTYNSALKTGTLTSEGETFTFQVNGNILTLTDPYSDTYSFTRTK